MYLVASILCLSVCLASGTQEADSTTQTSFFSDLKRAVEYEVVDNVTQCFIHGDKQYIIELIMNPSIGVKIVSAKEMNLHIQKCEDINKNTTMEQHHQILKRKKRFIIYPGTKWCGTGNSAANYDDLGEQVDTDRCCRTHDNCGGPFIAPFATDFGLTNYAVWYKKHCPCDDTFHACLKNVQNDTADNVGWTFFNFLGIECIHETLVEKCVERSWFGWCNKYETVQGMDFRDAKAYK